MNCLLECITLLLKPESSLCVVRTSLHISEEPYWPSCTLLARIKLDPEL